MSKIGFCCKWVAPGDAATEGLLNQKSTTITALSKKTMTERTQVLRGITALNLQTLERLVDVVGNLPERQRMLRITSDMLPGFTHEIASPIYQTAEMRAIMENGFAAVGKKARELDVRLSFHPGQYCLINNDDPGIYSRSVAEFEYHVFMMQMMGYGGGWHPHGAAINIHTGGRAGGTRGFIEGLKGLSSDARNLITVENCEFSFGLTDLEPIAEHCAIVLDIHHEWIKTDGLFIQPDDERIEFVKASWRGVKPLGHYSISPEDTLKGHAKDVLPDFQALVASGLNRKDLRAHSDMAWNEATNEWAISHLSWMDIEVEAKGKNLASQQLYDQLMDPQRIAKR